jgi:lactate dehydrogenase-like 2-hydroxyacid dehydrogenase
LNRASIESAEQNMEKPTILKAGVLPRQTMIELNQLFNRLDLPDEASAASDFLHCYGDKIRGMALRKTRIDAAFLDAVPSLEIISSYSAGLDNVDVAEVKARGIQLENTSHILAEDVANTALALALAVTRKLIPADAFVRAGHWPAQGQYPLGRSLSSMRVGIVALGSIGSAVARRLQALGAEVAYYGPHRKPVDLPYYDDITQLATDCDMLVLTCPLSAATRHLVGAAVLRALGPRGYLVNIARGPVVDETALIDTLAADGIAGAALDVFEHEPEVPAALIADQRLVLTPHIGSATEETRTAMAENVASALVRYFGLPRPRLFS